MQCSTLVHKHGVGIFIKGVLYISTYINTWPFAICSERWEKIVYKMKSMGKSTTLKILWDSTIKIFVMRDLNAEILVLMSFFQKLKYLPLCTKVNWKFEFLFLLYQLRPGSLLSWGKLLIATPSYDPKIFSF